MLLEKRPSDPAWLTYHCPPYLGLSLGGVGTSRAVVRKKKGARVDGSTLVTVGRFLTSSTFDLPSYSSYALFAVIGAVTSAQLFLI